MRTLVLGLGNELLSDDAVGIEAVRALRRELAPEGDGGGDLEIVETPLSGLALLDYFIGFDRAVVIDSRRTGRRPPGTVTELTPDDLSAVVAPSPHYAGLPEMLALARQLELHFPRDIRILAMEIEDPYTLGGELSVAVRSALPGLVARARELALAQAPAGPEAEAPTETSAGPPAASLPHASAGPPAETTRA